jgi:hypothetical protein
MQVDNLRAEVNQSAEVGQGLVGKDEHMDFNAAFELIADDGRRPKQVSHALEDTKDGLLTL